MLWVKDAVGTTMIFPDKFHSLQLQWPILLMFYFSTNILPTVMIMWLFRFLCLSCATCDSWGQPSQLQQSLPSHGTGNGRSTSDFRTTPIFPSVPSLLTLGQAILSAAKNQFHLQCWGTLNSIWTDAKFTHTTQPTLLVYSPTLNETAGAEMERLHLRNEGFLQRNWRKLIEKPQDSLLYQKTDRAFGDNVSCLPQIKHPLLKKRFLCCRHFGWWKALHVTADTCKKVPLLNGSHRGVGAAWALSLPTRTEAHCQRSHPRIVCLWQALAGRWSCKLKFLVCFCLDNEKSLLTAFQQPKLRKCLRF